MALQIMSIGDIIFLLNMIIQGHKETSGFCNKKYFLQN